MDYRDTSFPVIHSYLKMQRYFIYLSFNGAQYHGWQIQPNGITVQEVLEKALATLLRRETPVTGAGRTDAGVNARLMVAHFDAPIPLDNPTETVDGVKILDNLSFTLGREDKVAFVGSNEQAAPILLDGLSKLEYRGYDSAGIAVRDGEKETEVIKAKGRLKVLAEKTNGGESVPGTCGNGIY